MQSVRYKKVVDFSVNATKVLLIKAQYMTLSSIFLKFRAA